MSNKRNEWYSKLADQCRGVASCLSYNDSHQEGEAKHSLIEAACALDANSVRVHAKKDGLLIINAVGKSRYMNIRERVACWLLKGETEIRP